MAQDYSDLGLGTNLIKQTEDMIQMIDADTQIEDGSVRGTKLQSRSVPLDVLYGQDLTIGGDNNISGKLIAVDSSGLPRITIDSTSGVNVNTGLNSTPVFQAAISNTSGGLSAGDVQIGTYNGTTGVGALYDNPGVFKISGALNAGTISIGSNFGVDNTGVMTATNGIFSGTITAGAGTIGGWTINPTTLSHGSITLDAANNKISGGMIDGSIIHINHQGTGGSDPGANAYLYWSGGSHMWEDNNNNIGINSVGTDGMYLYVNNTQDMVLTTSTINLYKSLRPLGGIDFTGSIPGDGTITEGNINNIDLLRGHNDLRFQAPTDEFKFLDTGGSTIAYINHISGEFFSNSSHISLAGNDAQFTGGNGWKLNGNTKSAIVPTSKGYRALYCMESPEVWFMDFARKVHKWWQFWKKPNFIVDKTFLEVTVAPYIFMPTLVKGWVQVWGKRKGHENKRFEEKTEAEFKKNEEFLSQASLTKK
jgi:hypothetical protein